MNVKTILLLALVGLLATAGVATAQPATSPTDASNDDRQGPPDDLPGAVPDFVGDILDLIGQKLSGALSGQDLGDALSGLLGGDGGANADGQSG